MTAVPAIGNAPQIVFDWPVIRRELVFACLVCSLTGAVMVLLAGSVEWQGFMLAANLNALLAIGSIAAGIRWMNLSLPQARYLFLLAPVLLASLGSLAAFWLPTDTPLSGTSQLWLTGISMVLNLLLGMMLYSRAHGRSLAAAWQTEQLHNAEQRQQLLAAELKMLQAQIEPHFLFNTLANLRTLITLDPPTALTLFDHTNEYLRATLARARNDHSSVGDEFATLHHYLAIMQMRMGERLSFSIECPAELAQLPLPPLLVQPLVENAIKHGIEPSINGGSVTLSACAVGTQLLIRVADTGLGANGGGSHKSSVGLANVRERLHALFGLNAGLVLTSNQPRGMIATLTLPLATPET